jgi:hypothetical protein
MPARRFNALITNAFAGITHGVDSFLANKPEQDLNKPVRFSESGRFDRETNRLLAIALRERPA